MKVPLLLPLLLGLTAPLPPLDSAAALREGNRRFHAGDLEGAMAAYASGYDGSDPLLAYNLGAAAHHLERLPEALLWYRRAEAAGRVDDPWLRENLELVRGQLRDAGAREETGTAWSFWMEHRQRLVWIGLLLAWAALPALLLPRDPRIRRAAVAAVALAAGLPFAAGLWLGRNGPRAAVLLADCPGPSGKLPAGSEVRVFPADGRGWRVPGTGFVCPDRSVGMVEPPPRPSPVLSALTESLLSSAESATSGSPFLEGTMGTQYAVVGATIRTDGAA
ncbi:MAG TPA: hypothetical protein VKM72_30890 [Thermoanaerobaculia bacterium]|nr:hypothetical protein [Thermoanaerobaculia bacterium]